MFQTLFQRAVQPPAFGLDISDLTVKFVRVSERRNRRVLDFFGELEIPEGIIAGGEIQKEEELIRFFQHGLRASDGRRIRERFCVVSLPEEKSFVRTLELPQMNVADVGHAVRWEVEGIVPLPATDIYYDYELMPPVAAAEHVDVLLTAFPRSIVDSYHRVLSAAGLIPLALELESQSISRALVSDNLLKSALIIVDIGATRTSFIIFASESLVFTKSIALGGRNLEQAIKEALGVDQAAARAAKIEAGLDKNYRDGKVFAALVPHLTAITAELEQQIWFYRDHPARRNQAIGDIAEVLLCGGDANLIGLERFTASAVRRDVKLGDPFAKLFFPKGAVPPIPKNLAQKYTTAIGLALRAASRDDVRRQWSYAES